MHYGDLQVLNRVCDVCGEMRLKLVLLIDCCDQGIQTLHFLGIIQLSVNLWELKIIGEKILDDI